MKRIGYRSEFTIEGGVGRSIIFLPDYFVCTSPANDTFHVFSSFTEGGHLFSCRHSFSEISSLCAAGNSSMAVLSGDGFLSIWNVFDLKGGPKYRVHPQMAAVLAVCEPLNLIVTCDLSRTIVMLELFDGRYVRSFCLDSEFPVPVRLMLIEDGFLVVLCEKRLENEVLSRLQVFGLNSELLATYERNARVTSWCAICMWFKSVLAVAFDDETVVFLAVPSGMVLNEMSLGFWVRAMDYDYVGCRLLMSSSMKQILASEFSM
jgi:WD40 repeat protein